MLTLAALKENWSRLLPLIFVSARRLNINKCFLLLFFKKEVLLFISEACGATGIFVAHAFVGISRIAGLRREPRMTTARYHTHRRQTDNQERQRGSLRNRQWQAAEPCRLSGRRKGGRNGADPGHSH
jgi:hypothetical protein